MFAFLPRLFNKSFPYVAHCLSRRREARYTQRQARRWQARLVHPRLEDLEERLVLDAYTYVGLDPNDPQNWFKPLNWEDTSNYNQPGVPGANDTAYIPGYTVNLSGQGATIAGLTLAGGTLNLGASLTVASNGQQGSGSAAVQDTGTNAVVNVGGASGANASLNAISLLDAGTINVGGPNGGSSGAVSTQTLTMGDSQNTGILNIGAPGNGTGGTVTVSQSMTDTNGESLTVGGSGGSSGTLDVYSMNVGGTQTVNSQGTIDVEHDATFNGGGTTLNGGAIDGSSVRHGQLGRKCQRQRRVAKRRFQQRSQQRAQCRTPGRPRHLRHPSGRCRHPRPRFLARRRHAHH